MPKSVADEVNAPYRGQRLGGTAMKVLAFFGEEPGLEKQTRINTRLSPSKLELKEAKTVLVKLRHPLEVSLKTSLKHLVRKGKRPSTPLSTSTAPSPSRTHFQELDYIDLDYGLKMLQGGSRF